MENIRANPFEKSSRRFGKRGKYQRLNGGNKSGVMVVKFGHDDEAKKKKRSWKVRIGKRLRLKIMASPAKLWTKFKNAYLRMMLNLAGNLGYLGDNSAFPGRKKVPVNISQVSGGRISSEEFHNRLVYEIYKNLMASRELATV